MSSVMWCCVTAVQMPRTTLPSTNDVAAIGRNMRRGLKTVTTFSRMMKKLCAVGDELDLRLVPVAAPTVIGSNRTL